MNCCIVEQLILTTQTDTLVTAMQLTVSMHRDNNIARAGKFRPQISAIYTHTDISLSCELSRPFFVVQKCLITCFRDVIASLQTIPYSLEPRHTWSYVPPCTFSMGFEMTSCTHNTAETAATTRIYHTRDPRTILCLTMLNMCKAYIGFYC